MNELSFEAKLVLGGLGVCAGVVIIALGFAAWGGFMNLMLWTFGIKLK